MMKKQRAYGSKQLRDDALKIVVEVGSVTSVVEITLRIVPISHNDY